MTSFPSTSWRLFIVLLFGLCMISGHLPAAATTRVRVNASPQRAAIAHILSGAIGVHSKKVKTSRGIFMSENANFGANLI